MLRLCPAPELYKLISEIMVSVTVNFKIITSECRTCIKCPPRFSTFGDRKQIYGGWEKLEADADHLLKPLLPDSGQLGV